MCTTRSDIICGAIALILFTSGPALSAEHPHDLADCADCHGPAARGHDSTDRQCRACHGPESKRPWGASTFHDAAEDCSRCHGFHDPSLLLLPDDAPPVDLRIITAKASDLPAACVPCHGRGDASLDFLTPGHRAAAAYYHSSPTEVLNQSVSESCLRCHDSERDLPDAIAAGGWDPPRPHVQASHPYGVEVRGSSRGGFTIRRDIDPRLELVDGRMECTTCHDVFRDENDMLVQLGGSYADLCTGCHERTTSDSEFAMSR